MKMKWALFVLRKFVYIVPIFLGVCFLLFFIFHFVGGDPTYQMLGKNASAQQIADLRHELGLDLPLQKQFFLFMRKILSFDFGRSYATKQKITDMFLRGLPASLSLTIPAFFLEIVLGVALTLILIHLRHSLFDRLTVVLCVMAMSISSLAYILFGQYVFAYLWGLFPISGYDPGWIQRWTYLTLPMLIWVFVSLGINVRLFRTFFLDEVNQDYVRTARAKGLSETSILFKHVLRNTWIPIITYVVIQIPFLMTGSFLLESFFGIPGLGGMMIEAINNSDFPVIQAMTVLQTLLFIGAQFMTDLLYFIADPRVRPA